MKVMPKSKFDKVIELTRAYGRTGDIALVSERIDVARSIEDLTGVNWLSVVDVVDSILQSSGFNTEAENEDIYFVLRLLGWRVTDEVQTSEGL